MSTINTFAFFDTTRSAFLWTALKDAEAIAAYECDVEARSGIVGLDAGCGRSAERFQYAMEL